MSKFPAVLDSDMVGRYPASAQSGGGDYGYAFASYEQALEFSRSTAGSEEPLALVLQREYIDEPEDGQYMHVKQERVTEWPVRFLSRPRRTDDTLRDFFSPDAPPNRLDIIRGLASR